MDKSTSNDLTWMLQEIQRLLNQLSAFLADTGTVCEKRMLRIQAEPALINSLRQYASIISRQHLVEFLPTLKADPA